MTTVFTATAAAQLERVQAATELNINSAPDLDGKYCWTAAQFHHIQSNSAERRTREDGQYLVTWPSEEHFRKNEGSNRRYWPSIMWDPLIIRQKEKEVGIC